MCQTEAELIDHKFYFHKIPRPGTEEPDNVTNQNTSSTVTIPEPSSRPPLTVPESWSVTNPEPILTDLEPNVNVTRPVIRYLVPVQAIPETSSTSVIRCQLCSKYIPKGDQYEEHKEKCSEKYLGNTLKYFDGKTMKPVDPQRDTPVTNQAILETSSAISCQLCSKYFPKGDTYEEHKEKCGKTTKPSSNPEPIGNVQFYFVL